MIPNMGMSKPNIPITSIKLSYAVIMHPSEYIFLPKADIYLNRGLPISLRGGLTAYRYGSPKDIIVYLYVFFKRRNG